MKKLTDRLNQLNPVQQLVSMQVLWFAMFLLGAIGTVMDIQGNGSPWYMLDFVGLATLINGLFPQIKAKALLVSPGVMAGFALADVTLFYDAWQQPRLSNSLATTLVGIGLLAVIMYGLYDRFGYKLTRDDV